MKALKQQLVLREGRGAVQTIAGTAERDTDGLGERYRQVAERNRRQIRPPS